jgi:hypothetical protein
MNKHSKINLGPSSAHRWLECPASVHFIVQNADKLPDETTDFAEEGKLAHAYAAQWLTETYTYRNRKNYTFKLPDIKDSEMYKHVLEYVQIVRNKMTPYSQTTVMIENKIPLWYLPERNGYIDCVIVNHTRKTLEIIDLKYGMGVSVDPVRNPQLMIYAESFIQQHNDIFEFDDMWDITLTIYQPRDRLNNGLREWTINRKELKQVANIIEDSAHGIVNNKPGLSFVPNPDNQCKFCPAKSICSAHAGLVLAVVPTSGNTIELPNPNNFDRAKRVKVLEFKDALNAWLDELEKMEIHELMSSAPEYGFKVVEGKTHRKWVDNETAEIALKPILGDDIYDKPKLISVSEAERKIKSLGKADTIESLSKVIVKPKGKYNLVPVSDKREALNQNLLEEFKNIDI